MRTTHRRYWVFFLLFLFSGIAYLDRVNMSVAGKPIAHEFGLSPIALGYLFSSFLWAYVLMMLPGGRLIDRWGPACRRTGRDRGMVGGTNGYRNGRRLHCDVAGAARAGSRRGAVCSDFL
jgi:MFS family permease